MKTSYFRKRSEFGTPAARLAAAGLFGVLLIILLLRFVFPGVFFAAASPFFAVGTAFSSSFSELFSGFSDASALAEQNTELTQENGALVAKNRTLEAKVADLEKLTAHASATHAALAGVMARPPESPYDTLVVSLPPDAKVTQGALVSADGVPLGTVAAVSGTSAQVSLYSTPGRATDAWVGEKRIPITLYGVGAGAFYADIARDAAVVAGDVVYVAGPGALPIGTVKRVDTDSSLPRATLRIQPSINLFTLAWVLITETP